MASTTRNSAFRQGVLAGLPFLLIGIPFAWALIVGVGLWVIYRSARGWLDLANRQPLLLLLDDLQWADSASISLLFHLGRRLAGSRIISPRLQMHTRPRVNTGPSLRFTWVPIERSCFVCIGDRGISAGNPNGASLTH